MGITTKELNDCKEFFKTLPCFTQVPIEEQPNISYELKDDGKLYISFDFPKCTHKELDLFEITISQLRMKLFNNEELTPDNVRIILKNIDNIDEFYLDDQNNGDYIESGTIHNQKYFTIPLHSFIDDKYKLNGEECKIYFSLDFDYKKLYEVLKNNNLLNSEIDVSNLDLYDHYDGIRNLFIKLQKYNIDEFLSILNYCAEGPICISNSKECYFSYLGSKNEVMKLYKHEYALNFILEEQSDAKQFYGHYTRNDNNIEYFSMPDYTLNNITIENNKEYMDVKNFMENSKFFKKTKPKISCEIHSVNDESSPKIFIHLDFPTFTLETFYDFIEELQELTKYMQKLKYFHGATNTRFVVENIGRDFTEFDLFDQSNSDFKITYQGDKVDYSMSNYTSKFVFDKLSYYQGQFQLAFNLRFDTRKLYEVLKDNNCLSNEVNLCSYKMGLYSFTAGIVCLFADIHEYDIDQIDEFFSILNYCAEGPICISNDEECYFSYLGSNEKILSMKKSKSSKKTIYSIDSKEYDMCSTINGIYGHYIKKKDNITYTDIPKYNFNNEKEINENDKSMEDIIEEDKYLFRELNEVKGEENMEYIDAAIESKMYDIMQEERDYLNKLVDKMIEKLYQVSGIVFSEKYQQMHICVGDEEPKLQEVIKDLIDMKDKFITDYDRYKKNLDDRFSASEDKLNKMKTTIEKSKYEKFKKELRVEFDNIKDDMIAKLEGLARDLKINVDEKEQETIKEFEKFCNELKQKCDELDNKLSGLIENLCKNLESEIDSKTDEIVNNAVAKINEKVTDKVGIREVHIILPSGNIEVSKGIFHQKFPLVLKTVAMNKPVILVGPAGSGKNVCVEQVADALKLDLYYTNNSTEEYKLLGYCDANGNYHESEFYRAFKNGGIFFLDEMDASIAAVLLNLNSSIRSGLHPRVTFPNGDSIIGHSDFRTIGAANTWGNGADRMYIGRNQLDAATLRRYCKIEFNYDRNVEKTLVGDNYPELLDFYWGFRDQVFKNKIRQVVATSTIEDAKDFLESKQYTIEEILELTLLNGMSVDDKNTIYTNLKKELGDNPFVLTLGEMIK